jgi:hypothetical protein
MTKPTVYKPWFPAEYEKADVAAIQALAKGEANAGQQKRALDWIIMNLCRTYDVTYFPESVRDSDFASGKRFIGQQITKLINLKLGLLKDPTTPNKGKDQ